MSEEWKGALFLALFRIADRSETHCVCCSLDKKEFCV